MFPKKERLEIRENANLSRELFDLESRDSKTVGDGGFLFQKILRHSSGLCEGNLFLMVILSHALWRYLIKI